MSNLDEQFEEFMKESLSTDESPGTNSSPRNEPHVRMPVPESNPYKFWWMKEKPQTEKNPVEAVSHRSSLSGASGDSPKVDRTYAGISSVRNLSIPKVFSTPSPEITSSVAEFLEKEKLCKELSSSLSEVDSPGMGLDDVTDDDIGSIMEQLSQLAGSGDDGAAEKSVEEILKEAEDLVRETSHSFSGLSDTSDILRTPLTPPLLLRGTGASLFPMSTKSRSGSSTLSSSRRRNSISPSAEKKKKKKRDSARKSDKIVVAEEASEDEFSDFKLDTPLDTLRSFDASITRTGAVDPFVKTKELSKKEKSVTFEDIVSAFPSSCESDVQQRLSVSPIEQRDVQQRPEVRISVSPIEQSDVVVTPEVFQQTDTDVKEEVAAAMHEVTAESHEASSQSGDDSMLSIERELENIFGPSDTPKRPLSVVPEESSVSSLSKSEQSRGRRLSDKSVQVVDGSVVSLQRDLLEERNKVSQLQAKLESDDQEHKTQLDSLRCRHEEEMFNLKKDVYILNAKIADFEKQQDALKVEKGSGDGDTVKEHRITLLETELQQQEQLMLGYQRENVKLCQDMKQLRVSHCTQILSMSLVLQNCSYVQCVSQGPRASVKCLVMALTAAHVSCPTGSISCAGSTKP